MKKLLALLLALLLVSCSSTRDAQVKLQGVWIGKNADDFFRANGPPRSEFSLSDGGKIYQWTGGRAEVGMPGSAQTTITRSGNTAFANTIYSGGSSIHLGCSVQIETDKERVIIQIQPTGDSIGMWEMSRCAEIFR